MAERDGYVGTTLFKRITITRIALGDGAGPWIVETDSKRKRCLLRSAIGHGKYGAARSEDIKNHELTRNITQPTFHRSLKSLVSQGCVTRTKYQGGIIHFTRRRSAPMPAGFPLLGKPDQPKQGIWRSDLGWPRCFQLWQAICAVFHSF